MIDFQQLKISPGKYWDLFLHTDQGLLGRCYFEYKGEESSLMRVPETAMLELRANGERLERVLEELFHPDLFNHQSLNNQTRHLHVHVLPRYREEREFLGIHFRDQNFAEAYSGRSPLLLHPMMVIRIRDTVAEKYLMLGRVI